MVQRRVDEGSLCQLHGGEDREPRLSENTRSCFAAPGAIPKMAGPGVSWYSYAASNTDLRMIGGVAD